MDDSDIEAAAILLQMQAAAALLNFQILPEARQPNAANAPPNNLRAAVHGPPGVPDNLQEFPRRRRSARPQHQSVASVEWGERRARSARGRLQD
ncbi:hypothetical protein SLEP1_g50074 [Rubroshorea leprosula]|uniref:Uncharacterized protein n=1 Tax=Rubroshorea leprosula TaxID=152421 RepID=A0AAV5LYT7_9ROSI|nr:hypothetical protein SLEP1_g50074 [Rubroshorea leprosula]